MIVDYGLDAPRPPPAGSLPIELPREQHTVISAISTSPAFKVEHHTLVRVFLDSEGQRSKRPTPPRNHAGGIDRMFLSVLPGHTIPGLLVLDGVTAIVVGDSIERARESATRAAVEAGYLHYADDLVRRGFVRGGFVPPLAAGVVNV